MEKNFDLTLYLITDSGGIEEAVFLSKVEEAVKNGVTLVQLREKRLNGLAYFELGKKIKKITQAYHIPLIIDDRVDIAMALDADGVHIGQSDLPVQIARKLLGDSKIIGATAKTVEQAIKAYEEGADYLGVGAIFPTTTKVVTVITDVSMLRAIRSKVPLPIVAIGGLNQDNIQVLSNSPIDGVAVVSAIMKQENTAFATRNLRTAVECIISPITT